MTNITFRQVVIWGHKLYSHTHSYIHNAYFIAFQHLGYKTLWLDNTDDISGIDFTGSFFITEGQVDQNIPVVLDSYYLLHNCDMKKYEDVLPKSHYLILQVYTKDALKNHTALRLINKVACEYYADNILYSTWATDILPHEIDNNIKKVLNCELESNYRVAFIGTLTVVWQKVYNYCTKNNIPLFYSGGFSNYRLSVAENIKVIQNSLLAPAFLPDYQVNSDYIPCRIFKNISYGKMGITNSSAVYDLFHQKIIYSENIEEAIQKGLEFENLSMEQKNAVLIPLMEFVRDNHTYLNRIQTILQIFYEKSRT
jgi:hypothetical protein